MFSRKLIAMVAVALFAAAVFAGSAQASAMGGTFFGGVTVPTPKGDYPVPRGSLDHGVTGDGLHVESQKASFAANPSLCNWTMAYELRDLDKRVVDSQTIDPGSRCDTATEVSGVAWNKDTVPGFACAVLKVGGSVIAEQCHQVAG